MIVVTGATGTVGGTLLELLAGRGEDVVAVSRSAQPEHPAPTVRWARADVGDAASMRPVLAGARAVFLLVAGELNTHGEDPRALVDVVAAAGPERVVLVSSQIVGSRPDAPSHARIHAYETALRATVPAATVLRAGVFASNTLAWAGSVRAERRVYSPYGDESLPAVDPADISAMAAAALREEGHAGRVYEVNGPESITPRQQAAAISRALGEAVAFVELSREEAFAGMAPVMGEVLAAGSLDILGAPLPVEQKISPDVAAVLGRPAGSFDGWVARNLAAFR
jgi:uncharacterized protein YbjT (DUF2867 family)